MTAPTTAPVLAWVVPFDGEWIVVNTLGGATLFEESYESTLARAAELNEMFPEHAPHTVHQLARVVRVVAVDELATYGAALHALAAALTPPEPTGTEGA